MLRPRSEFPKALYVSSPLFVLRFHDLGTQNPAEVWIAIGEKDRRPEVGHPRMRVVRFSGDSLGFAQESRVVEGVPTEFTPSRRP